MDFIEQKYYYGDHNNHLIYGFTKRTNGLSAYPKDSFNMSLYIGDDEKNVHEHQKMLAQEIQIPTEKWVFPIQKHNANIEEVKSVDCGTNIDALTDALYDVDGLFTYDNDVLLTMNFADCVPVYFVSRKNNFIGLAHAGWRGTSEGITSKMIDAYDGEPSDLDVIIGPSINREFYHVDQETISKLTAYGLPQDAYKETDKGIEVNLKRINQYQALSKGVKQSHIYITDLGTEDLNQFFSYRLERGNTGRALAFIGRRGLDDND